MSTLRKLLLIILALHLLIFLSAQTSSAQPSPDFKKIDQFLQTKLKTSNIPGFAIAIVDRNKIIFSKGYGEDGNEKPVTGETPIAIASLSKAFTALAVMQLVEAGKVNLDSTITFYIPSIGHKKDNITVSQLLNQTSGFSDVVYPEMSFYTQPKNLDAVIKNLSQVELASKPGEKFHYHNPNYQVCAKLVEVVSGDNFAQYLQKNIFAPLQMKHTAEVSITEDFYTLPGLKVPLGYTSIFGYNHEMKELDWFVNGSAGMVSSANDLTNGLIMYLNKGDFHGTKLLSPTGIETMQTAPNATGNGYGMGWFISDNGNFSHTGVLWTSQSEQLIMTKQGYGVVILFNSGLNGFQDYGSFTRGVADILNHKDPETSTVPTMLYEILVGIMAILAIVTGVRRVRRTKIWQTNYEVRSKFNSWTKLAIRIFLILLPLFLPQMVTLISGRVLNWERVFWMMPGVVIWLGIVSAFNLIVIILRISSNFDQQKLRRNL